ncbi:hypothetical protein SAMN06265360_11018 [Haloechinothrix alba]|uniref:Metallothionein n=1 Tax=Haloechinothrix alba TaxID=664784 RepID=A0A238XB84_9PSEU|nr:hypothetical protein [Haloechinothrix alba]SNR55803.1 hypothetical protein SAMN06265360_11018 [Haloechinothrix alba]
MATCETCGNDFEQAFEVRMPDGSGHTFDSFECAISRLAPTCAHCRCRIIGHGVHTSEAVYCCAHCARSNADPLGSVLTDSAPATGAS